ncbi:related to RMS1-regulatory protein [Rhynchosporium secalis]|uniref:Related to RMS1-regulatory protein n=1 Tax=Rhynchosporium secalis TaxID=38038 RepID=A0A1E1MAW8_RHYSE|nr:related to RMS1-regulatory protein [Rhynchosporium secalis]
MEGDEFESKTQAFLTWLTSMGVVLNPKVALLDLRSTGQGRGVGALADIEEDEVLFTIPRSAVLNTTTALGLCDISTTPTILEMPSWLALTAIILAEGRRQESKWAPYLALLPRELDSLVFWSEEELKELQASTVVDKIGRATAEGMFTQHISPLKLDNGDVEMCHRVASIIMAYAFDIPEKASQDGPEGTEEGDDLVSDDGEDEKTTLSMIPLADMLNADATRNNARLCCDNEDLEMRSIKPIMKGDEIFNDYGQLPQSDLLRRYGYTTDNYALYDVAEISTHAILFLLSKKIQLHSAGTMQPLSPEQIEQRVELARREGVYEDSYDICHPGPDCPSIPDELLGLLYLLLLDEENLVTIEMSYESLPSRFKLVTNLVGQVSAMVLESRMKDYSTTAEDDRAIWEAGNLSKRQAMAVQVRLGEKSVLARAVQETRTFIGSDKKMRFKQNCSNTGTKLQIGKGKRKVNEDAEGRKKGRFM